MGIAMGNIPEPGVALLERLAGAVNRHDLDALEGCFASGSLLVRRSARRNRHG